MQMDVDSDKRCRHWQEEVGPFPEERSLQVGRPRADQGRDDRRRGTHALGRSQFPQLPVK